MDKDTWTLLRNAVRSADRSVPRYGRKTKYSDQLIVKMYLWTVAHDRPRCFATDRDSYSTHFRPRSLPSNSQFCRRLHSRRVGEMIAHVSDRMAQPPRSSEPTTMAYIDGKPLPVSESSKDPDARSGRGDGKFSRGYKLHALATADGRIPLFCVRSMNEAETRVARERLLPHAPPRAIVLADGNYDSKYLYRIVHKRGSQFFTPLKMVKKRRRPWSAKDEPRRLAYEMWTKRPDDAKELYQQRTEIERIFSRATCYGGGLGPLPSWVRRIDRVTMWVAVKLAIYHARLILREARRAAA